jgi:MFS family permease
MKNQIYSIGAILLSTAIFIAGNGLLGTLIPVRAHLDGFSDIAIGFIGSFYFVGFVAGCFAGPNLLARVGHIRAFSVGAAIAAATTLLQSMFVTLLVWGLMRALFGFAAANLYMVIESWLNERASNEFRGRIFSSYLIVNFSSLIVGQLLFATGTPSSFGLFDLCAICYAVCLIPVGLTRLPQPQPGRVPKLRPLRLYRIAPVGVVGCIAVGLANGALWTLAPIYAQSHGLTKGWLAIFMSAFTLGGAAIQIPLGRFSDRVDRRTIIAGVCGVSAVLGTLLAEFGGHERWPTLSLMTLFGMSVLPLYGLTVAHTNDRISREDFVEASATLLMISSLASVVGPPVAAFITGLVGTASLFLYTAVIHTTMAAFTLVRLRIKDAPASEHQAVFEPMPQQSSPAAGELDPRGPGGDKRAAA